MHPHGPDLSLIIPARQEALRLPRTLRLLQEFLDQQSYTCEIIPVIQGDDETATIVTKAAEYDSRIHPLYDPAGRGKGLAIRQGVEAAKGDIILFMDADLSVPLSCLQRLIANFAKNSHADLLIASRYLPESKILIPQPLSRRLLGRAFNLALRLSGLTQFNDTQCGCKLFRHDVAKKIFAQSTLSGFAFDVEILLLAKQHGYQIQEAPVSWSNSGDSRFGIFHDGWKALRDISQLRLMASQKKNSSL